MAKKPPLRRHHRQGSVKGKGDALEIEVVGEAIILKPIRRFKAKKWQDYAGIGEGLLDAHLKDKKKEKANEGVYP